MVQLHVCYAAYLHLTGFQRPYREQVLAAQSTDGNAVMENLRQASEGKHVYAKHMGKHFQAVHRSWLQAGVHVILVREPLAVINSFSEVLAVSLEETCYPTLCTIVSDLRAAGRKAIVVLSEDLVQRPEQTLQALCREAGLAWDPAMLRWPAGPKPYDGVWAPYWYRGTHASTGWASQASSSSAGQARDINDTNKILLHECNAMYSLLLPHALNPQQTPLELPTSRSPGTRSPGHSGRLASFSSGAHAFASAEAAERPAPTMSATHAYEADPRNADILVGMRDGVSGRFTLEWRPAAKVSVLDAGFVLGDGVWEGLRVHKGVIMFAREHLDRLYQGLKALAMDIGLSCAQLQTLIYKTLDANGMRHASGVHVRLMVTRGLKATPYQNPHATIGAPTVVILPEWKAATARLQGITLSTAPIRRGAADVQDPMLNSHSKLNCIGACIHANHVGADEALMLDPHGFVATCNSTNFFIVVKTHNTVLSASDCDREEDGQLEVWAPTTKYQLHGITRANILQLCRNHGIPCCEKDFSLTTVYSAEEAFVTGTFAGLIPVAKVDGRTIGSGTRGLMCSKLQELYKAACDAQAEQGRLLLA